MTSLLSATYHGNSVGTLTLALLVAGLSLLVLYLIRTVVFRRLSTVAAETRSKLDDIAVAVLRKTHLLFMVVLALCAGSSILSLPSSLRGVITKAAVAGLFLQGAVWGSSAIELIIEHYVHRESEQGTNTGITSGVLLFFGRVAVWTCALLAGLSNLGLNVTTLVAGLGVGSVAVALGLQSILGDLFAAVSIILDKPFAIGDFIIIDTYLGTVEHIGVKSTRVRSLDGELIVFSNSDLLKSRIRNYKRMYERRIVFAIGVTYNTAYEKLASIPNIIRHIVEGQDKTRFDRAHFKAYGNFSLDFEIVYYVKDPDYNVFMDIQQAINLAIFRRFAEEGIEFAFPTQTILFAEAPQGPTAGGCRSPGTWPSPSGDA